MAPIMAAATSRPKKQAAQTGRVVKRPARGFHRFRNGIMNVTPKGGEKELVKNNQESFLLKLPGELRHKIWEFAIGVNLFRPTSVQITQTIWARRMVPRITDREHALALLQTCRQIYAETARLPYKSGILNAVDYRYIKRDLSYLKPFQRAQFSELRLEAYHENLLIRPDPLITDLSKKGRYNLDFLPGLKCIRVVIFKKRIWVGHNIASLVAGVRARLDLMLVGKNIAITVEIVDVTPEEYCDF